MNRVIQLVLLYVVCSIILFLGVVACDDDATDTNPDDSGVPLNYQTEFDGKNLDITWTILHYDGTGDGSAILTNGVLEISNGAHGGGFIGSYNTGSVVYYPVPSEDFEATAHIGSISTYDNTAVLGLFCDASNSYSEQYLIVCDAGNATGSDSWGILKRRPTGDSTAWDGQTISPPLQSNFYVRLTRTADVYQFSYSLDGTSFTPFTSAFQDFSTPCSVSHIGLTGGTGGFGTQNPVTITYESFHIQQTNS
jgi:hypothetical protein